MAQLEKAPGYGHALCYVAMKKKTCATCRACKPVGAFAKNAAKRDGLGHSCRECHATYTRRHYAENVSYYVTKAAKNRAALNQLIASLKAGPCADCGVRYPPYVMDFDHRDPSKKSFTISMSHRSSGARKVREEIAKCDLVCANCHRERTYGGRG